MGATLEQKISDSWKAIVFVSPMMNPAKINSCELEEKTLSIVFALTKFHEYVYGKKFITELDH